MMPQMPRILRLDAAVGCVVTAPWGPKKYPDPAALRVLLNPANETLLGTSSPPTIAAHEHLRTHVCAQARRGPISHEAARSRHDHRLASMSARRAGHARARVRARAGCPAPRRAHAQSATHTNTMHVNSRTRVRVWRTPGTPGVRTTRARARTQGGLDAGPEMLYPVQVTDAHVIDIFVVDIHRYL